MLRSIKIRLPNSTFSQRVRVIRTFSLSSSTNSSSPSTPSLTSTHNHNFASNILQLSKARLSSLVVTTTAFGYLASGLPPSTTTLSLLTASCVGTALCASSASAINQILEIDLDKKMIRTKNRPLPSGSASPLFAKSLALTTGVAGTSMLALCTNPVTAALGAGNIALYGFAYTLMKTRSEVSLTQSPLAFWTTSIRAFEHSSIRAFEHSRDEVREMKWLQILCIMAHPLLLTLFHPITRLHLFWRSGTRGSVR